MNKFLVFALLMVLAIATAVRADCNNEEKSKEDSDEGEVKQWFKSVGCSIQNGASKVKEGAKKLGADISVGAKKFGESAKKFGSDVKTKFGEWKDKVTDDSDESTTAKELFKNVELAPEKMLEVAKVEEKKCGNGYILDALGECKKFI